jgi:hypothetical protein
MLREKLKKSQLTMKLPICNLILGIILLSCNSSPTLKIEKNNETVISDTVLNMDKSTENKVVVEKKDTVLFIENKKCTLSYSAKMDISKLFRFTEIYIDTGRIHKDIFIGYNATYTISLKDSVGKSIFTKSLTKDNFSGKFYGRNLAESNCRLPQFKGYVNSFKSFLFTIDFDVPDSDIGDECFLMINNRGEIIENSVNNHFGGGSSDGEVEIPTNENFVLTCRKIINVNGQKIEIADKSVDLVGTKLINDNIILVINQYSETKANQNAKLIDNFGKTLKSFTYKGYYVGLGYNFSICYDSIKGNYFLIDEELKNLRVINKKEPLSTYTVSFNKMKPFNNDKLESEILFIMYAEISTYTVTYNSLTNTFRYRKNE